MSKEPTKSADDRDMLETLKAELNFLEKGGYGRSVKTPWVPTSIFQDSPSCFCYPKHEHDSTCSLMQFVPSQYCGSDVPCHHIPLNAYGVTVAMLEGSTDQEEIEEAAKNWLRARIAEIERERAATRV
jgi:hypothetical protein